MVDSVSCLRYAECSRAPDYITNGHGSPMQTTSCTWPYVVPIGEDPAAHGHWCAFTDLYHTSTIPYRRSFSEVLNVVDLNMQCISLNLTRARLSRRAPKLWPPSCQRVEEKNFTGHVIWHLDHVFNCFTHHHCFHSRLELRLPCPKSYILPMQIMGHGAVAWVLTTVTVTPSPPKRLRNV